MGSGQGIKSNIWIIFNLSNGKHLCGVSVPAEGILVWRCVLVMCRWTVFKPFNVIQIESTLNFFWKSINHGCAFALRQLWQSHSLILRVVTACHCCCSIVPNCFSCRRNLFCPLGDPVYSLYWSIEPQSWGQSKHFYVSRDSKRLPGHVISKSHSIIFKHLSYTALSYIISLLFSVW